jgi:hypothetical protein
MSTWSHSVGVLVTLLLLVAGYHQSARADTTYWRVRLGRVTVIADDSPQRCTRLASEITAFEGTLRTLVDWNADYVLPPLSLYSLSKQDASRVFLTDTDRRQQRSDRMIILSKWLPGPDFNVAAIANENGSDDPLKSVMLVYAEAILIRGPMEHFPPWYLLGLPNLLNDPMFRPDGSILLNRNLPYQPVNPGKRATTAYNLQQLLDMRPREFATADYPRFMRLARDWALFGLLTTPERRPQYRELAALMTQGESAADAVKDAFGVPLETLSAEFEAGRWRNNVQYRLPALVPRPVVPPPEQIEAAEANTLLQVVAARISHQRGH